MAYPGNHTIKTVHMSVHNASVGTTPLVSYVRIPFRSQLLKLTSIIDGALTSADAACVVKLGSTTAFTHTIVQPGSAAGQLDSTVPASPTFANEDDVLSITPGGSSGANVRAYFTLAIRQF